MAKRLIDADAFVADIKTEILELYFNGLQGTPQPRDHLYDIIDRIDEQPTVDAVEVVRCKDCIHRVKGNWAKCIGRGPDDFCSDGVRRFYYHNCGERMDGDGNG